MKSIILSRIPTDEAPFLMRQVEEYRRIDLRGYSIVNNTPLTISAIVKMMPFIKNDFKLKTTTPSFLGRDTQAIRLIQEMGYEFDQEKQCFAGTDIILDCCAELSGVDCAKAIAELTKTGVDIYRRNKCQKPVLSVDDSRVKALETYYGTSDGFVRAFKEFISPELRGTRFLIFGFGKVGKGIVRGLTEHAAKCTVVDINEKALRSLAGNGVKKILYSEMSSMPGLLNDHDFLVTSTGINHFISTTPWPDEIAGSKIRLINMGAEDEFGPRFVRERVENGKMPLNFKLKRPTLLKYLDPVFYAHNSVVALYHDGKLAPGLQPLPKEIDDWLVSEWHSFWGVNIAEFNLACPT
ncbi:MAG: NAD-binding protein [Elusimicrobia bacterium]|nr:NAD-binding protein [Elusimicrobiota bacterium]